MKRLKKSQFGFATGEIMFCLRWWAGEERMCWITYSIDLSHDMQYLHIITVWRTEGIHLKTKEQEYGRIRGTEHSIA